MSFSETRRKDSSHVFRTSPSELVGSLPSSLLSDRPTRLGPRSRGRVVSARDLEKFRRKREPKDANRAGRAGRSGGGRARSVGRLTRSGDQRRCSGHLDAGNHSRQRAFGTGNRPLPNRPALPRGQRAGPEHQQRLDKGVLQGSHRLCRIRLPDLIVERRRRWVVLGCFRGCLHDHGTESAHRAQSEFLGENGRVEGHEGDAHRHREGRVLAGDLERSDALGRDTLPVAVCGFPQPGPSHRHEETAGHHRTDDPHYAGKRLPFPG